MNWEIRHGDVLDELRKMPDESVNCVVTSPPYWGLRDYGVAGQIGLEPRPEDYVAKLVAVFRRVRDVLAKDGTLWLNMGDSYSGSGKGGNPEEGKQATNKGSQTIGVLYGKTGATAREAALTNVSRRWTSEQDIAPKNMLGIPWRVAFALQADGWYLRSDIIWAKPNPMPESVTDRPTRGHEYLFLLSKNVRYYYDAEAIKEPAAEASYARWNQNIKEQAGPSRANGGRKTNGPMKAVGGPQQDKQRGHSRRHAGFNDRWDTMSKEEQGALGRNKRSVWTIATHPYAGAHFATFPPALVEPCILAGCPPGGLVLDPFSGAGTTVMVALRLGRRGMGIELNSDYVELSRRRIMDDAPLLNGTPT